MGHDNASAERHPLQKSVEGIIQCLHLSDTEFETLVGCGVEEFHKRIADPDFSFVDSSLRRAVYLIRIFNALAKLYGNNASDMQRWLRGKNSMFNGPPIDYVNDEKSLETVVDYLEKSLSC